MKKQEVISILENPTIMERMKTFKDCVNELARRADDGDERAGDILCDYESNSELNIIGTDVLAYLRLRVIASALNEGWEPVPEKNEPAFYPWFSIYSKAEYDPRNDENKVPCLLRLGTDDDPLFVYELSPFEARPHVCGFGSGLAFKSAELAAYAGKVFPEDWCKYLFGAH